MSTAIAKKATDLYVQNWTDGDPDYCYYHSLIGWNLGGHVPRGVTAHGSPGGPLQFDRLEAALCRQVPLRHLREREISSG